MKKRKYYSIKPLYVALIKTERKSFMSCRGVRSRYPSHEKRASYHCTMTAMQTYAISIYFKEHSVHYYANLSSFRM